MAGGKQSVMAKSVSSQAIMVCKQIILNEQGLAVKSIAHEQNELRAAQPFF